MILVIYCYLFLFKWGRSSHAGCLVARGLKLFHRQWVVGVDWRALLHSMSMIVKRKESGVESEYSWPWLCSISLPPHCLLPLWIRAGCVLGVPFCPTHKLKAHRLYRLWKYTLLLLSRTARLQWKGPRGECVVGMLTYFTDHLGQVQCLYCVS